MIVFALSDCTYELHPVRWVQFMQDIFGMPSLRDYWHCETLGL